MGLKDGGLRPGGLRNLSVDNRIPDSPTAQYQYDATLLSGFQDGDTVSSWSDNRVSGVTITGGGTFRSGSNGIAANDAIAFDGSNDGFASNETRLSLPAAAIAVVKTSSLPSSEQIIVGPAGDNSDRLKLGARNGSWFAFAGGGIMSGSSNASVRIVSVLSDGTGTAKLREDGTQTDSDSDSGDNTEGLEAVSIGFDAANDRRYWDGLISFVEIHQGISESQLAAREQEIADYLGIIL